MCMFITDSSRYEITPPITESRNTCLSVDGQLHEDGDSWHDGCRLCYCFGGQEMCALISCPRPYCSIPVFRLGDCCPSCPGEHCLFSKVNQDLYFFIQFSFIVNTSWHSHFGHYEPYIFCDFLIMSDLYDHNIEIIKIPPKLLLHFFFFNETLLFSFAGNVILPQSKGTHEMCKSLDGRYFVEGETWHLDNCTQCICHNGSILCETHACPPVLCSYPTILPNSCCPVCKGQAL